MGLSFRFKTNNHNNKKKQEKTITPSNPTHTHTQSPRWNKEQWQQYQQQLRQLSPSNTTHQRPNWMTKKRNLSKNNNNTNNNTNTNNMSMTDNNQTNRSSSPLTPPPPQTLPQHQYSSINIDHSVSFDTRKSTPKATGRSILRRSETEKMNNLEGTNRSGMDNKVSPIKESYYELPPSIHFLSLVLPSSDNHNTTSNKDDKNIRLDHDLETPNETRKEPSILSVSDTTTITSVATTDVMSVTSGLTTLAKDRVQETIACSEEAERYIKDLNNHTNHQYRNNNSPKSVDEFIPGPMNVDFVLESNEYELATFVNSFIHSKQYDEAIDIYLTVLAHLQKQFGPQYPIVITTIHNLAVVNVLKGDYNKALKYCQKALKLRQKTLGSNHADVVTSLCELGIIYYAREDFNRSLDTLRQALQMTCNTIGHDQPDHKVASILNNIGCVHFSMGKLIASITTFEESLDIQRRLMGSISSDEAKKMLLNMSMTLCNAGIVSAKHNRSDIASSLVEEALLVQQSILPDDHRLVQTTSITLSSILGTKVNLESSPDNLEINLSRQLSTSSQDQKLTETLSQCSDMLLVGSIQSGGWNSQKRVSSSMQYKYLVHLLLKEGNSKRHCSWVNIGNGISSIDKKEKTFNLAQVCEQASLMIQRKEINKATVLFHKIRQSRSNKCGDVDVIVASIHHILGLIHLHTKNYQSARVEFQEASKIRTRQLDPDHLDVLESQTKRAITMMALQDFDNAILALQSILTHVRKRFGYSHYRVAIILNNIGICHYEYGGLLAALKAFEESVEILRDSINCKNANEEVEGSEDKTKLSILLGRSLENLSFIQFNRKEYAESIVALEECLKVYYDVFGNDHKIVKSTIESLANVMATSNCLDNKDKLKHMAAMYIDMLGSEHKTI